MIIRPGGLSHASTKDSDEVFIDFKRLGHIAREKAVFLVFATLLGFVLGLTYTLYQFFKPIENRLETEILFVGSTGAMGATGMPGGVGVTGVTGVTGVKEADSVLFAFDPEIKMQQIAQDWPDLSLLIKALDSSGLQWINPETRLSYANNFDTPQKHATRFLVKSETGRAFWLLIKFESARNKSARIIIQGPFSREKIVNLADNLFKALNDLWSQKALDLAKAQRPYLEKVRAQLVKEPAGAVQNLPQLAQPIQITADLSLLSNYQKIRLIDQFLDKLKDWPSEVMFVYPGLKRFEELRFNWSLWAMPFAMAACFLFGPLVFFNFYGPQAHKIFVEQDLAFIHQDSSIYPSKMSSSTLVNLLASSFARSSLGKPPKLAVFVPKDEPELIEKIRSAAGLSGRSFSTEGSEKAEVLLFSTDDPSGQIASLPAHGFGRILLTSRCGNSLKIRHRLYQAEADLAGISISDVLLLKR